MIDDVENIYIFVADALRWDYLPESIRKLGRLRETVASSTLSPSSFASITSGLYPPKHGVRTFSDQIPQEYNWLLKTDICSTSFWQSTKNDPIYNVLDQSVEDSKRVDHMNPPFINIERNLLTHAPYGYTNSETNDTAGEYLNKKSRDLEDLRQQYRLAAKRSASVFHKRINQLKRRNILNDTLVVFTSDHGELLGEYGCLSHVSPLVPEMVYVPTVFILPDNLNMSNGKAISQVDIAATVADVIGTPSKGQMDGISLFSSTQREHHYSGFEFPSGYGAFGKSNYIFNRYKTSVHSLWDADGGWVFNYSPVPSRVLNFIRHTIPPLGRNWKVLIQEPNGMKKLLSYYIDNISEYGNPNFSRHKAQSEINALLTRTVSASNKKDLSKEQREQLKKLGYI